MHGILLIDIRVVIKISGRVKSNILLLRDGMTELTINVAARCRR